MLAYNSGTGRAIASKFSAQLRDAREIILGETIYGLRLRVGGAVVECPTRDRKVPGSIPAGAKK